jgi:hypothetical protein
MYNDPSHVERAFESLGMPLEEDVLGKLCQEPVAMLPIEQFQASTTQPFHTNTYNVALPIVNGTATAHASLEYIHGISSIAADADEGTMTDAVVFAPERPHYVSGSVYGYDIAAPGNDLAAVGSQFVSDPYVSDPYCDYTISSYTNGFSLN